MSTEPQMTAATEDALRPLLRRRQNRFLSFFKSLLRKPPAAIAFVALFLLVFSAIFADIIAPYPPLELHPAARLKGPMTPGVDAPYVLGTDNLGRDVLSRIIHGARISLWVGILSVTMSKVIGTTLGMVSGFFGGKTDAVIMRIVDAIYSIPQLILTIAMAAMLGPATINVVYAITFTTIPPVARVIRGATLSITQNEYITAARALGASNPRIIFRYVLPNVFPLVIVYFSLSFAGTILAEASLSFLGLGTPPPTPSWGGMLSSSGRQFFEVAPWLAIWPGIAITMATLSFNLMGDALRDILDPRMRGAS